jgi:hypothetical protein
MSKEPTDAMVRQGKAMPAPGQDRAGRFPIENRADLENAIQAVGRAKGGEKGRALVRRFIMRRARALKLEALIPDNWNPDGTLKNGGGG